MSSSPCEKAGKHTLTLDQPVTYEISVPGQLDEHWSEWAEMTVTVGRSASVTILTAKVDQAALHSLLRHLYALGVPLISVICVECEL